MKKFLAIILILCILISCVACSKKNYSSTNTDEKTENNTQANTNEQTTGNTQQSNNNDTYQNSSNQSQSQNTNASTNTNDTNVTTNIITQTGQSDESSIINSSSNTTNIGTQSNLTQSSENTQELTSPPTDGTDEQGLHYIYDPQGQFYTVKAYYSQTIEGWVRIPEKVDNIIVKIILNDAFKDSNITGITIPITVTKIGNSAFENCSNLVSLDIKRNKDNTGGLEIIGDYAFSGCSKISLPTITVGVVVGEYAFANCKNFTTVNWNVKSIGDGAFLNCTELFIADFKNAETIGKNAFENCEKLYIITINSNYGKICVLGEYAFKNCTNLSIVQLHGLNMIPTGIFTGCVNIINIYIGKNTTKINKDIFNVEFVHQIIIDFDGTQEMWDSIIKETGNNKLAVFSITYLK